MNQKKRNLMLTGIVMGFMTLFVMVSASADMGHSAKGNEIKEVVSFEGEHTPVWYLKAGSPLLIGGYGDNFSYDGSRVTPLLGSAEVVMDAEKDTGTGIVKIQGTINPEKDKSFSGDILLVFRVKKSAVPFQEGGVADFVYLHGNTKQDAPVMPKTRTFLGAWGEMDVYVNSVQVYKNLMGHIMYTERTRDTKTRAIYNKDKSGIFSHKDPTNGSIAEPTEREIHFVAHSMQTDKGNFPPHSAWIHLNFGNVSDLSGDGIDCGCPSQGLCGPDCTCGCQAAGTKVKTGAYCNMKGGKCGTGCSCGCLSGKPCDMNDGKCAGGCGCGCQVKAGLPNCECGPGCSILKNCNCGPNCECPKDGKGGCGCSVGCNTGCAKGGACPLPKPLGT